MYIATLIGTNLHYETVLRL